MTNQLIGFIGDNITGVLMVVIAIAIIVKMFRDAPTMPDDYEE